MESWQVIQNVIVLFQSLTTLFYLLVFLLRTDLFNVKYSLTCLSCMVLFNHISIIHVSLFSNDQMLRQKQTVHQRDNRRFFVIIVLLLLIWHVLCYFKPRLDIMALIRLGNFFCLKGKKRDFLEKTKGGRGWVGSWWCQKTWMWIII